MREAINKFWPPEAGPPPSQLEFTSGEAYARKLVDANKRLQSAIDVLPPESAQAKRLSWIRLGIDTSWKYTPPSENLGGAIAGLFEALAEEHLIQPTIIYDFPLAVSPLSKVKPEEPDWVERFEFYIGGFEVGNAFSELNDPVDQHGRFAQQLEQKERGDEEAMSAIDEDYVRALGYGLPPTAGEGIGIDRLTMVLTGARSIRDVILFPLMRPQAKSAEQVAAKESEAHGESVE